MPRFIRAGQVNGIGPRIVGGGGGAPANDAPVATPAFIGDAEVGVTLAGLWGYTDTEGDLEGTSITQWYRADDALGTNEAAIAGATSSNYTLVSADTGKFVRLGVIPVALTGTSPGSEAFSSYSAEVTDPALDLFITEWSEGIAGSFSMPTTGTGYSGTATWKDSLGATVSTGPFTDGDKTALTVAHSGTNMPYTCEISGDFPTVYFASAGDKLLITDIKQFGTIVVKSMFNSYFGCTNIKVTATDAPNFDPVGVSMANAFLNSGLAIADFSSWAMGNVTSLSSTFSGTSYNNPIGDGDTGRVGAFDSMLGSNDAFDQDLGGMDITGATIMTNFAIFCDGWSTANYDATLNGWKAQVEANSDLPASISFHGGTSVYSINGAAAHAYLTNPAKSGWTIADGGFNQASDFSGWFDASDSGTITESANAVSSWDDQSPEYEPVVQATGTEQPLIGSNTINGLQTITFDGTNDQLQAATNVFGATVEKASVFAVIKSLDVTNAGSLFSLSANGTPNSWRPHSPYSDGVLYFDNGGTSGTGRVSVASGFSDNDENLISYAVGTNLQEIRLNGVQIASDATSASCTTSGGVIIGSDDQNFAQHCAIGEMVIVAGDVSTTDRQIIEGYLAHKWGQEGQLDAGHPYKSAAP